MSRTRSVAAGEDARLEEIDAADLDDPVERAEWLEAVLCEAFEMDAEDARRISGLVIDQFGDKDELLDDEIPNDIRSVFYTLESKRILTFRRIEYEGEEGATLRGFYWRFNPDVNFDLGDGEASSEEEDVYDQLPEDCWERDAAA